MFKFKQDEGDYEYVVSDVASIDPHCIYVKGQFNTFDEAFIFARDYMNKYYDDPNMNLLITRRIKMPAKDPQ